MELSDILPPADLAEGYFISCVRDVTLWELPETDPARSQQQSRLGESTLSRWVARLDKHESDQERHTEKVKAQSCHRTDVLLSKATLRPTLLLAHRGT